MKLLANVGVELPDDEVVAVFEEHGFGTGEFTGRSADASLLCAWKGGLASAVLRVLSDNELVS